MPVFVDTNVLVYARDASETEKQPAAAGWIDFLWRNRQGRLSLQVLQEYYVTVTRKLSPGLDRQAARREVRSLLAWKPLETGPDVTERAWRIEDQFDISPWDALIVSAAGILGCETLLTEDLTDGQKMQGLRVVNPFRHPPA